MTTTRPLPDPAHRTGVPAWLFVLAGIGLALLAAVAFWPSQPKLNYSSDWNAVANKCGVTSRLHMDDNRAYVKGDLDVYPSLDGWPDQTVNQRTGDVVCYVQISSTPLSP